MIDKTEINKPTSSQGLLALSPIIVFIVFYLGVSLYIGDFYKLPISIAFIVGTVWAIIFTKSSFVTKIEIFSKGAAHSNILFMVWIFILAGAFANIAKNIGAIDATVELTLKFLPTGFLVPGIFCASCLISLAIGTSVGTVTAIVPLALELALSVNGNAPYFVAAVLCGSFFGDNLSFISDTTIAATRTQGCSMRDKFRANIWIALPAAIIVILIYIFSGDSITASISNGDHIDYILILPYLLVIITAILGVNVLKVLMLGIISSLIIGIIKGFSLIDMCNYMGDGIDGMGSLIIITLLAAGLLALIDWNGGIKYLISILTRHISNSRWAMAVISLLVGLVNICTANNTVAIITMGKLSKSVSNKFNLDSRKVASVLDTSSCIVQCIIPYGAQMLLATSLAGVSPMSLYPYLYYPAALAIMVLLSIIFNFPKMRE